MSDCGNCQRTKRENKLIKEMADTLNMCRLLMADEETRKLAGEIIIRARQEAGR